MDAADEARPTCPDADAPPPVTARERAALARTNPLAAGLFINCFGVAVPAELAAATGGIERAETPAAAALRRFLDDNPWHGMLTVSRTDWLLLSSTPDRLLFAERVGPVGFGTAVEMTRTGSTWEPGGAGGCGPAGFSWRRSGEPVFSAEVTDRDLVLHWTNGTRGTDPGEPERTVARVLVQESATAVHVLLISELTPPRHHTGPPAGTATVMCIGVGIRSTATVRLREPLGRRALIDDARIPGGAIDTRAG